MKIPEASPERGRPLLVEAGVFKQDADTLAEKVYRLHLDLREKNSELLRERTSDFQSGKPNLPIYHVIETPSRWAPHQRQPQTQAAVYGLAVGAAIATLHGGRHGMIYCPRADEWPWRGLPTTRGDPHKEGRVRYVEQTWGIPKGSLGAKTYAGNVADAMLMINWMEEQTFKVERREPLYKNSKDVLVFAIDPATTVSGFAIAKIRERS